MSSDSASTTSYPPWTPVPFPLNLGSIKSMLDYRFRVLDTYIDVSGLPTFVVIEERVKAKIVRVSDKLVISVFPKPSKPKPRLQINLVLFLATVASVAFASYTLIFDADPQLIAALFNGTGLVAQVVILAVAILGIVVLHELVHVLAVRHHRMDATLPYFIPAPPPFPFGTFGAMISLRGPPANRDQLFDLGFSGPIAGFIATLGVAVFAYFTAPLISQSQASALLAQNLLSTKSWPYTPMFIDLLEQLNLRTAPSGRVLVLTQVAFAAEVGALITFLNILPVWQLDGGHITRAVFGDKGHRLAAFAGFGVLFLAGYWGFALMLIIFMFISRRPLEGVEPLDDISSLSTSRKLLFAVALLMLLLCFVIF